MKVHGMWEATRVDPTPAHLLSQAILKPCVPRPGLSIDAQDLLGEVDPSLVDCSDSRCSALQTHLRRSSSDFYCPVKSLERPFFLFSCRFLFSSKKFRARMRWERRSPSCSTYSIPCFACWPGPERSGGPGQSPPRPGTIAKFDSLVTQNKSGTSREPKAGQAFLL